MLLDICLVHIEFIALGGYAVVVGTTIVAAVRVTSGKQSVQQHYVLELLTLEKVDTTQI